MSEEVLCNLFKNYTCCLTGHRVLPQKRQLEHLRQNLRKTIARLVKEDITFFYTGGAVGFDTLAAMTVLEMKAYFPQIRLYLALPCPEQHENWGQEEKKLYEQIKEHADRIELVSPQYSPDCMKKRNYYMVDRSCVCAYYMVQEVRSGTAQTVNYARHQGCDLIDLSKEISAPVWNKKDEIFHWSEEVYIREFYPKEGEES